MKAAWQAVGAARAKTFPAVCLAPHSRKHHAAVDAHAAVKRRRTLPDIDARILPDSTVAVVATVEGRVGKLLKLHSPAKKTSAAASIIIKVSPSPSSSLALSLSVSLCRSLCLAVILGVCVHTQYIYTHNTHTHTHTHTLSCSVSMRLSLNLALFPCLR